MPSRIIVGFLVMGLCISSSARAGNFPPLEGIDVQHYRFDLVLSDSTDEIKGTATIEILFTKKDIQKVRLDFMSPSPEGKGMTIEGIVNGTKQLTWTHAENMLWIQLPSSSQEGQRIMIVISYHGIPSKGLQIKNNKYNERTFFSDNWPDLAHCWLPVADHPADKATCEFVVTAPVRYQVISNGLKVEETNLNAAQKITHWKQSVPLSPWLYVLGAAEFAVQYVDEFDGKSIQTWVFHQDRNPGFSDFAEPTKDVLEFYSEYVGPFAYEKLANIQASSVAGGMEAASAILYNEKSVTGDGSPRWKKVVIHEIAHQWFGCAVTESTWDDVWLSEGFATYFTALYIEHAKGKDEFINEMKNSRSQVHDYYKKFPAHTVIHHNLRDMSLVTSTHTYQKGAWTLHMLRSMMGEVPFQKGIRNYYARYRNGTASTKDFQTEMEKASGLDLTDFFNQWLRQGGYLSLQGGWSYDAKKKVLKVDLAQIQKDGEFSVPVEIGIYRQGQSIPEIKKVNLTTSVSRFSIPLDFEPADVKIDPNTILLAEVSLSKL